MIAAPSARSDRLPSVDFDRAPFLVIWETTRACDLACKHCRASAESMPDPRELTVEQGRKVVRDTAEMGTPILVLSGGDPAKREDLLDLIRYGKSLGLRMATIPAATPRLTRNLVRSLKQAGLDQMAVSIDFPRADLHDGFRGVPGTFARSVEAAGWAREEGLPLQVNTTVWRESAPHLEEMAELVERLGAVFWEVFFLVPIGRGTAIDGLNAVVCEALFSLLHGVQKSKPFVVKVTEAPHYRRFVAQVERARAREEGRAPEKGLLHPMLRRSEGPGGTLGLAPRGVNSGNGFLFVAHTGEIFPSGFLPLSAGNVKNRSLADAYRNDPIFRELRNPELLTGRCGRCEYRSICAGSRSRAYAMTGDWLEDDPWCGYEPRGARTSERLSVGESESRSV